MLFKLMPLMAMAGIGAAGMPAMRAQVEKFQDMTRVTAVQMELQGISKVIYLEYIAEDRLPPPETIAGLIKANMSAPGDRDVTLDMWDTPYAYRPLMQGTVEVGYEVISFGPDRTFGTEDDIIVKQMIR